jgi:chemotaxis protein MotB
MQDLISAGVKPDMIAARGFGEASPIASNKTAQGRAKNRRVEVTLAGQTSP